MAPPSSAKCLASCRDFSQLSLTLKKSRFSTSVRGSPMHDQRLFVAALWQADGTREGIFRTVTLVRPPRTTTTRLASPRSAISSSNPSTVARIVVDARSAPSFSARTCRFLDGRGHARQSVSVDHGGAGRLQPAPLSRGQTVVTPQTNIDVNESGGQIALLAARPTKDVGARAQSDRRETHRRHRHPASDQSNT